MNNEIEQLQKELEESKKIISFYREACCSFEVFFAIGGKPTEAMRKAGEADKAFNQKYESKV